MKVTRKVVVKTVFVLGKVIPRTNRVDDSSVTCSSDIFQERQQEVVLRESVDAWMRIPVMLKIETN